MDKKMKLFELVPLQCTRCGARIASGSSDMIYFCDNCGAALEYNGETLVPIEARFAQPLTDTDRAPELFLPFWSFRLDIAVEGKSVYLPLLFRDNFLMYEHSMLDKEAFVEAVLSKKREHAVEEARDFIVYVPSFPTTGAYTFSSELGTKFTLQQPSLTFYEERKKIASCIYNAADALAIAEDEYISLQSAVIPNLLALDLSINVKEKLIIGMPYVRKEKGIFYDQIIGEMLLASALRIETV
jgi:predicted RNA-binding Zn-ribbon protein involved in translation (DUF1610 family)